MSARGLYSDPSAARSVLDAIGGPAERPKAAPILAPVQRAVYLGRCGNGEHPAQWIKIGDARIKAEHCGRSSCNRADDCGCRCAECLGAERAGCPNEIEPEPNNIPCACASCRGVPKSNGEPAEPCVNNRRFSPVRLCKQCRAKYAALEPKARDRNVALDKVDHVPGLCWHGQKLGECGSCVKG